jgi:hypothetical protein
MTPAVVISLSAVGTPTMQLTNGSSLAVVGSAALRDDLPWSRR